eukprot:TRINITY_DN7017_c0_g1_i1.p1 TRINITY_DN7017_c0_g1~~TRINITY_DN7017_c0_g1_i1.p1  ORF type:complete len:150 (-),score=32.40 TRINITY_DN7017_c0_g1_i1:6-455(-)
MTQLDITGLHSAVPGSVVVFYKNGVEAGVAFRDVRHGVWYPAVGLYGGGTVTLNFGPNFRFPPTPPPGLPTPWPIRRLERVLMLLLVFDDRHPRPPSAEGPPPASATSSADPDPIPYCLPDLIRYLLWPLEPSLPPRRHRDACFCWPVR